MKLEMTFPHHVVFLLLSCLSLKKNETTFKIGQIDIYLAANPKRTIMIGFNIYADNHGVRLMVWEACHDTWWTG